MSSEDVVVIGAGPAGLAAAAELRRHGVRALVIERSDAVGAAWRGRYDSLRLHTPRELSGLPGLPIPREMTRWVARDDLVTYLEQYAAHHRLDVQFGAEVTRIVRTPAGAWQVALADGGTLTVAHVVVAAGNSNTTAPLDVPGADTYTGELVPAPDYRNGARFAGGRVLVVGSGNTGTDIAVDLVRHRAASVWLAVRTPPHILPRNRGPVAAQHAGVLVRHLPLPVADRLGWLVTRLTTPGLRSHGLARPRTGLLTRVVRDGKIPVLDHGIVGAIRAGTVRPVAALARLDGSDAVLVDGSRFAVDAVVAATGYRRGLEPLVGALGVLDGRGRPPVDGGRAVPGAPGLWFIGYTDPISGMLREIRIESRRLANAIATGARQRTSHAVRVVPPTV
ncbi:flavin-containing monooxygenase [Occultella gossypii]|uniref:NAD(P)/FAD-dependent oxidoreductase n=1 Tax=Occultella gossypii TaxID=2800820 RepID=A0ABS7SDY5_9MICO|nr:NAD(P)/FAD-dependent oxidoreductase [Occultella gossypii]MBZ2198103.1 NAD(P)/FAD-dependent oxidoreductase [Occultella gossypii]